jgi:hypothetical protein
MTKREAKSEPALEQATLPFWWVTSLAVLGQLLGILSFAAAARRDEEPRPDPMNVVATFMTERLMRQSTASSQIDQL